MQNLPDECMVLVCESADGRCFFRSGAKTKLRSKALGARPNELPLIDWCAKAGMLAALLAISIGATEDLQEGCAVAVLSLAQDILQNPIIWLRGFVLGNHTSYKIRSGDILEIHGRYGTKSTVQVFIRDPASLTLPPSVQTVFKERNWTVLQKMGSGTFGETVCYLTDKCDVFVAKYPLEKADSYQNRIRTAKREVAITQRLVGLNIPNVVKITASGVGNAGIICMEPISGIGLFQMRRLNHTNMRVVDNNGQPINITLHEAVLLRAGRDVLHAFMGLGPMQVIHRDVFSNIMVVRVFGELMFDLVDFGCACDSRTTRPIPLSQLSIGHRLNTAAPETLAGQGYSFKTDIHALGVALAYAFFDFKDQVLPAEFIRKPQELKQVLIACHMSDFGARFITRMLEPNPALRPTAQDLLREFPELEQVKVIIDNPPEVVSNSNAAPPQGAPPPPPANAPVVVPALAPTVAPTIPPIAAPAPAPIVSGPAPTLGAPPANNVNTAPALQPVPAAPLSAASAPTVAVPPAVRKPLSAAQGAGAAASHGGVQQPNAVTSTVPPTNRNIAPSAPQATVPTTVASNGDSSHSVIQRKKLANGGARGHGRKERQQDAKEKEKEKEKRKKVWDEADESGNINGKKRRLEIEKEEEDEEKQGSQSRVAHFGQRVAYYKHKIQQMKKRYTRLLVTYKTEQTALETQKREIAKKKEADQTEREDRRKQMKEKQKQIEEKQREIDEKQREKEELMRELRELERVEAGSHMTTAKLEMEELMYQQAKKDCEARLASLEARDHDSDESENTDDDG